MSTLSSKECPACERALGSLQMYGVPPERARSVANGIGVLAQRCRNQELALADEVERLRQFIEMRCVGAGPEADAERWRLIDGWRKARNKPPENETRVRCLNLLEMETCGYSRCNDPKCSACNPPAQKANSCIHIWSVKGPPRNPEPHQFCDNGCGLKWKDRQEAERARTESRRILTCVKLLNNL